MYSARKKPGNPLWIARLFEYAVRQNRQPKTDVFLCQRAFAAALNKQRDGGFQQRQAQRKGNIEHTLLWGPCIPAMQRASMIRSCV